MIKQFQQFLPGRFIPLKWPDLGPPEGQLPQSKVAEKSSFRHFDRQVNFTRLLGPQHDLGQVRRKVLGGLAWHLAVQLGQLWAQGPPEGDLEILERAP